MKLRSYTINWIFRKVHNLQRCLTSTFVTALFQGNTTVWRRTDFHSKWLTSWTYKLGSCKPHSTDKVITLNIKRVQLCVTLMCSWCSFNLLTSVCRQNAASCLVLGERKQEEKKSTDYHVAISLTSREAADISMDATLILRLTQA